jgi:hypothetical protein
MTRKHFEAVADAIAAEKYLTTKSGNGAARLDTLLSTTKRIADIFAQSNPRFNRDRFMAACGF